MAEEREKDNLNDKQEPTNQEGGPILSMINPDELRIYVLKLLQSDIRDRDTFQWAEKLRYSDLAYNAHRDETDDPWPGAAHYSSPLTRTLVDTAHANVIGGIFANREQVTKVNGIGDEDVKNAKNLSSLINWQIANDIKNSKHTIDMAVYSALKYGNAIIKVLPGYEGANRNKVNWVNVPIENIFMPLDARGAQPDETDHIFELIPLTEIEVSKRKYLKGADGKLVYPGIEDLKKGTKIFIDSSFDTLINTRDAIAGTSLGRRYSEDYYYILECYLTYWVEKAKRTVDLVVRIASNGGKLFSFEVNTDVNEYTGLAVRPYSLRWIPFPFPDRIYGDSLPWIVKPTQEEMDHSINQNINAGDELIKPMKFYDPSSGFDPFETEQTPNGWYPVPDPTRNVYIPNLQFNPIFERALDRYWEYAQRATGLTELFQGRQQDTSRTLGEAQLRTAKTEVRFKVIYKRLEEGLNELLNLTYFYDRKYMPDDVKVKVLGTSDFQTVKELFPEGLSGRYNFSFASEPDLERSQRKVNIYDFVLRASAMPIVQTSLGNQYKILELLAEVDGIRNIESIVRKPKEAGIISPQEAIQRLSNGEKIEPSPNIDFEDYLVEFKMFTRSQAFEFLDEEIKRGVVEFMLKVESLRRGQIRGILDAMILKQGAVGVPGASSLSVSSGGVPSGTVVGGNGGGL